MRTLRPAQLGIASIAIGFILIIVAWNGAAGVSCLDCQLPYLLSGGFAGLAFVVLGGGLLMFESMRRQREQIESKLDELVAAVREGGSNSRNGATLAATRETARANGMVAVGRSSFHKLDCKLIEGKDDLDVATPEAAQERGLTPCRVCEPLQLATSTRRR